jgi:CRP/FNR family transcriptional regulator, dissimilatory nitrate respiration regulator
MTAAETMRRRYLVAARDALIYINRRTRFGITQENGARVLTLGRTADLVFPIEAHAIPIRSHMPTDPEGLSGPRQTVIMACLRQNRIFQQLPSEDIAAIAEACELRTLQKGEQLFREGEPTAGFYVLQLGQVGVYFLTPDGREQTISVFRAPESFGEAALVTLETYPANAAALEYSRVILVRKAPFRELISRRHQLALQMLVSMSMHLKELLHLLQSSRGRQAESRVAEWLMQQSPALAAGCPTVLQLPIPKKVLASQLGITSETLSRTFGLLREAKVIRVTGSKIFVTDPAKLRDYANGTA